MKGGNNPPEFIDSAFGGAPRAIWVGPFTIKGFLPHFDLFVFVLLELDLLVLPAQLN